jgi:Holliday junction resolvasome RuvABC endonuclease subunit
LIQEILGFGEYKNQAEVIMDGVLALDLGSLTGYAICARGKIVYGTKKLRHSNAATGVRALDFHRWLSQIIQDYNVRYVYFERVYAHSGTAAAHLYGYFMHALAAMCEANDIECTGIPVGTIKKFATGSGKATKDDMIAFAKARGYNPLDDNAADALAVLFAGLTALKKQENSGSLLINKKSAAPAPGAPLVPEFFRRLTG